MPVVADPAAPRIPPAAPPSPLTFLLDLGGRALLFAELCAAPGQAPLALVEDALRGWARRRRWRPAARWPALFWQQLLRRLRVAAPPAQAAGRDLLQAVQALPLAQRQAFLLRVWLGFELPAVARLLDCSPEQAGRLLYLALQQLRAALGVAAGDQRWLLHGRAALELRAGTLALTRQAALAAAIRAALAARGHRLLALALAAVIALLFGQRLQPPAAPPATPGMRSLDSGAAVPVAALEQLLSLPAEDFALLTDPAPLELLAELEFHLWRSGPGEADGDGDGDAALVPVPTAAAAALDWSTLSAEQRRLLAPFAAGWTTLPAAQQQQLHANAAHWQQLEPAAQARLQQRLAQLLALPAPQRQQLRLRHQRHAGLSPALRAALARGHAEYLAQPEERRAAERSTFAALAPAQRRAYLLSSAQREQVALAGQLFAFVPPEQLPATLALLDALGADGRERLLRRTRRLAPWQREELRVALLQADPAGRERLLRE
jgi:hypothetical protein